MYTDHTANKGPMRIQYKCLVPIYVFPEIKLLFPKQNYNVLSSSSYTHISVRDSYISRISLPILLEGNMWSLVGRSWEYINHSQTHECVNWDWGRWIPRKGIHKWDCPCSVLNVANFYSTKALYKKNLWTSLLVYGMGLNLIWSTSSSPILIFCSRVPFWQMELPLKCGIDYRQITFYHNVAYMAFS